VPWRPLPRRQLPRRSSRRDGAETTQKQTSRSAFEDGNYRSQTKLGNYRPFRHRRGPNRAVPPGTRRTADEQSRRPLPLGVDLGCEMVAAGPQPPLPNNNAPTDASIQIAKIDPLTLSRHCDFPMQSKPIQSMATYRKSAKHALYNSGLQNRVFRKRSWTA